MAVVLWVLSWFATILACAMAVLCLAAGLTYLAELIEEYSVLAKKILQYAVLACVSLHVLLGITGSSPAHMAIIGALAHIAYSTLLMDFPFFDFKSFGFVASLGLFMAHNYTTFQYYTSRWFPFDELSSYFVVGVWLVPFAMFLSLSANDNTLPTQAGGGSTGHRNRRQGGALALLAGLRAKVESFLPIRNKDS